MYVLVMEVFQLYGYHGCFQFHFLILTAKNSTYAQPEIKQAFCQFAKKKNIIFFIKKRSNKRFKKHVNTMKSEIAVSYLPVVWFGEPLFLSCTTSTHIGNLYHVNYSLRYFSPYSCSLFPVLLSYAFGFHKQGL